MLISVRSASLWWSEIITDFFIWSFPSGTANSGLPAKNVGVLHAVYLSRNYICSILRSIRDQRRPEVICLDNSSIHFPHLRSWWWGKFSQLTESKRSQTPGDRRTYSQFTIVSEHVFRAWGETCRAASRRFRASNPDQHAALLQHTYLYPDRSKLIKKNYLIVFMHCFCNWCISTGSRFHICNIYLT